MPLPENNSRECYCFARQPFQIAVFAKMNHGLCAKCMTEPCVKGQVTMWRREVRVVIAFGRIDVVAAGGLDRDHHVAKLKDRQDEFVSNAKRIFGRVAPAIRHSLLDG